MSKMSFLNSDVGVLFCSGVPSLDARPSSGEPTFPGEVSGLLSTVFLFPLPFGGSINKTASYNDCEEDSSLLLGESPPFGGGLL